MKVKGYCPHCEAWRAFTLEEVRRDILPIFSINSMKPTFAGGLIHHTGTCSRGHRGPFTAWEPLATRKYNREPETWHYKGGRAAKDTALYHAYRLSFRRPLREKHYMTGHQCGPECPEYFAEDEWPIGEMVIWS